MPNRLSRLVGAAAIALCAVAVPAQAKEPLPISEYGKLPDVERSAISPSGDRIAVLTTMQGKRVILAIEDQTKALTAIAVGDTKVRGLRWISEDRLLLTSSQTEDLGYGFTTDKAEVFVAQVLPLSASVEGGTVFGNSPKYPDIIIGNYGIRQIDGKHYGFFGGIELVRRTGGRRSGYQLDHARPYLFKVDLQTFEIDKIANAAREGHGSDWVIDADGEIAYSLDVNYTSGAWSIRNRNGDRVASGQDDGAAVSLVGLGNNGENAIYAYRGEEKSEWFEVGPNGGEPTPFLNEKDFERLFFNRETGQLMGYVEEQGDEERHIFFDKALEAKANRVRKAFSAYESWISGWTSDLSDVIVKTSGNGDSGTYYAVDLATNRANALAYERLAITPEYVGPISTFEYTASDGMEMDGILTLPPGVEAKDLPVVVLPHGGPHSSDSPTFDWWAQAFASRGYAVFQPNFRGSTNRDAAFTRAGYGEWGRKMQTDKSDGLMALAEAGIVDPKRACIVGASYGGYAALAGVTLQQGLYKCAVAVAPVSDIRDMYQQDYRASGRDKTTRFALRRQLGQPDSWDAVSPLLSAAKADAPILLIHGRDDTVVPYSHSTKMADKLKDAGKPYQFVTLDEEDHWLSLSETRQTMLKASVEFVQKHNPAD